MSNSELNRTANWYRCVGTLYETNLKLEDCDIKLQKDGEPNGTTKGERILGSVSVQTDKGINTFNVYAQNLTAENKENKRWKMYKSMLDWNPKVGGNSDIEPTLVNIEGGVEINDYTNQNGDISSTLRWRVNRANTKVSAEDPKGTTLQATLYIDNIKPEIRNIRNNEEETGRLIVTLYGANSKGACFPITAYVNEDMADDFTECYDTKMTVPLTLELTSRHIGDSAKGGKKKFGRNAEVSVNSGFDVQELIVVGGDDEIEEPDELTIEDENGNEVAVETDWINPSIMNKAKKERANMLEELKKNSDSKQSTSSLKQAKQKMKAGMKTQKQESFEEFDDDDDDLPF